MQKVTNETFGFRKIALIGFLFDIREAKNSFKVRSNYRPTKGERDLLDLKAYRFHSETDKKIFRKIFTDALSAGEFPFVKNYLVGIGCEDDFEFASNAMNHYLERILNGNLNKTTQKAVVGHLTSVMDKPNEDRFLNIPDEIVDNWIGREVMSIAKELKKLPNVTDESTDITSEQINLVVMFNQEAFFQQVLSESRLADDFYYIKSLFPLLVTQQQKVYQDLAIRIAWLLSYFDDNIISFVALAEEFDWNIDRKTFPWLNHELITYYRNAVSDEYDPGLTVLDNMKLAVPAISLIESRLEQAHDDHTSQFDVLRAIHDVTAIVNNDELVIAQMKSEIDSESVSEAATCIIELPRNPFSEEDHQQFTAALSDMVDFVTDIQQDIEHEFGVKFYKTYRNEIRELFETQINSPLTDFLVLVQEYIHFCHSFEQTDQEAKTFLEMGDALFDDENWQKLSSLKEEIMQLKPMIPEKLGNIKAELAALQAGTTEFDKAFGELVKQWQPNERNDAGALREDLESVRVALSNCQHKVSSLENDNNELQFKLNDTKEKLTKAQRRELNPRATNDNRGANDDAVDDFLALALNGSVSLEGVVDFLTARHQDSVTLSKSVMKSLANNREFSKLGTLFEKLNTLMSKSFLEGYSQNGSNFAFSHFTPKELSFNESEQTLCAYSESREFTFDDGEKRLCEKHLRIGTSGKRQHMLRVYFTIENAHLYIGDIVPHLPTSTKR